MTGIRELEEKFKVLEWQLGGIIKLIKDLKTGMEAIDQKISGSKGNQKKCWSTEITKCSNCCELLCHQEDW